MTRESALGRKHPENGSDNGSVKPGRRWLLKSVMPLAVGPRGSAGRWPAQKGSGAAVCATAVTVALSALTVGCTREITVPYVGDCADYPTTTGPYDYGDFSIGDCLGAPTDLKFYEGPDGPALLVVNSNAYMVFGDGSLLAYDWESLEAQIEAARLSADPLTEAGVPPVLLTSDPSLKRNALPTPYYVGKLEAAAVPVDGGTHPVGFLSNRLSLTTDQFKADHLYAVDLSDPLDLAPFDVTGHTRAAIGDDSWEIAVGKDPYGMAFVKGDKGSYLLAVNESEHSVSVVDTAKSPMQMLTGSSVGLVTWPGKNDYHDTGRKSFTEVGTLAVGNGIVSDTWTLTYLEGNWRMFFAGQEDGKGVIGLADSADGASFQAPYDYPILGPGESDAWDADGVGRSSLLLAPSSDAETAVYILFYEGWRNTEALGTISRIGIARTTSSTPFVLSKDNLQSEDLTNDDFILDLGADKSFDELGLGSPWVFLDDSEVKVWFTGTDEQRRHSLGVTSAAYDDLTSWSAAEQLSFAEVDGDDHAGVEQRDATGFYDLLTERYRLWFVRENGDGTSCLVYSESTDGLEFTVGGLDGGPTGCLLADGDAGTDAVVRSPSIIYDGHIMRMWYVSAPDEALGPWTVHYAFSFDGFTFKSLGQKTLDLDVDFFSGPPSPVVTQPSSAGVTESLRLSGVNVKDGGSGFQLQTLSSAKNLALYFQLLHGHVLGAGARDRYVALTDEQVDNEEEVAFSGLAWDSYRVTSPAWDSNGNTLFYAGVQQPGADDETATELLPNSALGQASQPDAAYHIWENASCRSFPATSGDGCDTAPTDRSYGDPEVVHANGATWLYYASGSLTETGTQLWLAKKADGQSSFSAVGSAAILSPDPERGETDLLAPSVVTPEEGDGKSWHMWFTSAGSEGRRIGYASSTDGVTWVRSEPGSWALTSGSGGDWDDSAVESPSVLFHDGVWHMWYAGSSGSSVYQIGYATATPEAEQTVGTMTWTRSRRDGVVAPVVYPDSGWWDAYTVSNPDVHWSNGRFHMFYEGQRNAEYRIGLAESLNGRDWFKVYEPLTNGDSVSFNTRLVNSENTSSAQGLSEGVLSLDVYFGGYQMCGNGATEIAAAPDGSYAVVSAIYTPGLYVIDTRDDSSGNYFDGNFLGYEAAVSLQDSSTCGPDQAARGTRSLMFNPSGKRLYATTKVPDSVVVFDMTKLEDQENGRLIKDGMILGSIELEPGSADDQGDHTSGDLGPIGLAMTRDGRYLWVANANGNSVYTIDLTLGTVGEVVQVARDVGEIPVALALSPDEKYLMIANYVGEVEYKDAELGMGVPHAFIAVLDADPTSTTFGQVVAQLKNLELPPGPTPD